MDIVRKATNSMKAEESVEKILDMFARTRDEQRVRGNDKKDTVYMIISSELHGNPADLPNRHKLRNCAGNCSYICANTRLAGMICRGR